MASIFLTLTAMYLWHLAADVDWEVSNRVWVRTFIIIISNLTILAAFFLAIIGKGGL